jgi:hypothetical protein
MQKYISRISDENLEKFMIALNRIAIAEGLEDVKELRQDSTVIETNIHYPTNNSLVYDRVKENERLLEHLKEEIEGFSYEEYKAKAKQTYFKINVEKDGEERIKLFKERLKLFILSINQVSNIIKKKSVFGGTIEAAAYLSELEGLLPVMEKVYAMTERHEILKEKVPVEEKIFSIYEQHTDIIVKGKREVQFGHKNIVFNKGINIPDYAKTAAAVQPQSNDISLLGVRVLETIFKDPFPGYFRPGGCAMGQLEYRPCFLPLHDRSNGPEHIGGSPRTEPASVIAVVLYPPRKAFNARGPPLSRQYRIHCPLPIRLFIFFPRCCIIALL